MKGDGKWVEKVGKKLFIELFKLFFVLNNVNVLKT